MQVISKIGGLQLIREFNHYFENKNILLVTGNKSFEASGAKKILEEQLKGASIKRFCEFSVNPKLEDAVRGAELARSSSTQVIVAVGGGSVIDMAKLIKAFYACDDAEADIATGQVPVTDPNIPLLTVPTTAGSGSEATHFAVVYLGSDKYSLADACLLPDAVILDGSLALAGSKYQKSCNVLDAMAQAIESYWAVGGTFESRLYASSALEFGWDEVFKFVGDNCTPEDAQKMIEASNLAGKAINISKTTAAHAWSYAFTSEFGIPHGHAVWLTLPTIFQLHHEYSHEACGSFYQRMNQLTKFLKLSPEQAFDIQLKTFMSTLDIAVSPKELGLSISSRTKISKIVNMQRMQNNPYKFKDHDISRIFSI